jgi:hypothetical protein
LAAVFGLDLRDRHAVGEAPRDALFTFLRQPGLDATNWRAELAVRFGVILREVWGGSRTWAGARAQSVLMSVWRTCWQQGRSALDFLSQRLRGNAGGPGHAPVTHFAPAYATRQALSPSSACWYDALIANLCPWLASLSRHWYLDWEGPRPESLTLAAADAVLRDHEAATERRAAMESEPAAEMTNDDR